MQQTALVTGGSSGIGAGISLILKDKGYNVIATYIHNPERAEEFQKTHGINIAKFDVGNFSDCENSIKEIIQKHGPIDTLVNNAGVISDSTFLKMNKEKWDKVLNTNLNSCFNVTKQILPSMIDNRYGRIINISSVNGQSGAYGQTNYASSKAGVIAFSKSLALEVARFGVTVNSIAPGYIATDMVKRIPEDIIAKIVKKIPVGRLGSVKEIAHAVAFLASKNSGYCTGSTLSINGGQYMTG